MISSENQYHFSGSALQPVACFGREWNSLRAKSTSKFNKLISSPTIRCCDRPPFREPLTRHPRFARCATFYPSSGACIPDVPVPRSRRNPVRRVHRHHHHRAAQEGPAKRLDARHQAAAARSAPAGRTGLYAALRARARGSRNAGILVVADLDPHRDRSDAERLHCRGRRHGRRPTPAFLATFSARAWSSAAWRR